MGNMKMYVELSVFRTTAAKEPFTQHQSLPKTPHIHDA